MREHITHMEGVEGIDIGATDEGFKLYLDRKDGEGVAIPISTSIKESLERVFMEFDGSAQDCESCKYGFTTIEDEYSSNSEKGETQ